MPIDRFLKDRCFRADEIEVLDLAFEQFLQSLGLRDRNDRITAVVATRIIAVAEATGLRNASEISEAALKELRA